MRSHHVVGQVGVAVAGEHHFAAEVAVDHFAYRDVGGEHGEFLAVVMPVDRQHWAPEPHASTRGAAFGSPGKLPMTMPSAWSLNSVSWGDAPFSGLSS